MDALAEPTSEVNKPIAEAATELARCLRLLTPLFGDHEFRDSPPEVRIEDGHAPLPEEPFAVRTSHRVTLYTRGDLNRPVEQASRSCSTRRFTSSTRSTGSETAEVGPEERGTTVLAVVDQNQRRSSDESQS